MTAMAMEEDDGIAVWISLFLPVFQGLKAIFCFKMMGEVNLSVCLYIEVVQRERERERVSRFGIRYYGNGVVFPFWNTSPERKPLFW